MTFALHDFLAVRVFTCKFLYIYFTKFSRPLMRSRFANRNCPNVEKMWIPTRSIGERAEESQPTTLMIGVSLPLNPLRLDSLTLLPD